MKITIENGEGVKTASILISDDSTSTEALEEMIRLLIAYGYHPDSVFGSLAELCEEYRTTIERIEKEV